MQTLGGLFQADNDNDVHIAITLVVYNILPNTLRTDLHHENAA